MLSPHADRTVRSTHAGLADLSGSNPFLSVLSGSGPARTLLAPGTRLGRFHILRHLGSGSLGDVYLARDELRGREVAVKVVDVGPCGSEEATTELRRELAAYDRIHDHRNVLKVHDMHPVRWGGTELLLLSMEYADGGTLREWLRVHREDRETRSTLGLACFRQVCQGVAAAHEAGIIHLDLKPENVLFVGGKPKVSDFNVSAIVRHLTVSRGSLGREAAEGMGAGTPLYMAPEQWVATDPSDLDARADIYSLGVLLYETLHPEGRPPCSGSVARLREFHLHQAPPALPGANAALQRVVRRCLAKDPADRYQTVQELLDDLDGGPAGVPEDEEAEAAWEEARRGEEEGRFADAQRLCRRILELCPDHEEASRLSAELQERYERASRLYAAIERGMETQSLEELTALLVAAVDAYPEHPLGEAVQIRLQFRARQYRQAMEDAIAALGRGEWETARARFVKANELNPGARESDVAVRSVERLIQHVAEERRKIDQALAADRPERALALAEALDKYLDGIRNAVRTHARG